MGNTLRWYIRMRLTDLVVDEADCELCDSLRPVPTDKAVQLLVNVHGAALCNAPAQPRRHGMDEATDQAVTVERHVPSRPTHCHTPNF